MVEMLVIAPVAFFAIIGAIIFVRGSWIAFFSYCQMFVAASIMAVIVIFVFPLFAKNAIYDLQHDFLPTIAAWLVLLIFMLAASYSFIANVLTLLREDPLGHDPS